MNADGRFPKLGVPILIRAGDVSSLAGYKNCSMGFSSQRAMKTKYECGSFKRLLGPDNKDTSFVANFKQII